MKYTYCERQLYLSITPNIIQMVFPLIILEVVSPCPRRYRFSWDYIYFQQLLFPYFNIDSIPILYLQTWQIYWNFYFIHPVIRLPLNGDTCLKNTIYFFRIQELYDILKVIREPKIPLRLHREFTHLFPNAYSLPGNHQGIQGKRQTHYED